MQVRPEELQQVARVVQDACGIVLDDTKAYLVESRLSRLAEELGCKSFSEYALRLRSGREPALRSRLIDAITTQETLFFRDGSPFEALQHKVLPEIIDTKSGSPYPRRLRIWSAACSTGQEPYSLAMTLCELIPDWQRWDLNILATDISDSAIKTASTGRYARHEIQRGMRPDMLRKYFHEEHNGWRVRDELRSLISFQRRNLLEPFTALGPFDVILCRNVAIYFEQAVRRDLFLRLADRLTPEGALFSGSSESLSDLGRNFVPLHHCRAVFYQPRKPQPVLAGAR